jgi:Tfp pilus assembly protein PilN
MIRINLISGPRPKKGKRGGGGGDEGDGTTGPGGIVFILAGIILGVAVAGFFYMQETKKGKELDDKLVVLGKEATDLQGAKTKVGQLEKQKVELENRKKAIDELVNNHVGPVSLMDTVGNTVNGSDAVWLDAMSDNGSVISMDGNALTTTGVANFMTKLKSSGYFKSVDIKDAAEVKGTGLTYFHFSLNCEKAPVQKPAAVAVQPAASQAPANKPGSSPAKS